MKYLSVLIIDQSLDHKGIISNASFVLGLTVGRHLPEETFGPDVTDGDSSVHKYLTNIAHFVRKGGQGKLKALRAEFMDVESVTIVDYPEDAAPSDYAHYQESLGKHKGEEITYRAIHFYGPEEILLPRTKNLSSLS